MLFALLDAATAVQSICLLGGQGNAGTRPERRCKSGMDGGLTAASLLSSPPLYLRTAVFLSNQPGPPHSSLRPQDLTEGRIKKYMTDRLEEGASNRTVNMELSVLSRALGHKFKIMWPNLKHLPEN